MLSRLEREKLLEEGYPVFQYMAGGKMNMDNDPIQSNNFPKYNDYLKKNMCDKRQLERRVVLIPAKQKDILDPELEDGIINLTELLNLDKWPGFYSPRDKGTKFKIPNKDWLVKNKWITEAEKKYRSPFFLKSFSLVPFPIYSSYKAPNSRLNPNKKHTDDYKVVTSTENTNLSSSSTPLNFTYVLAPPEGSSVFSPKKDEWTYPFTHKGLGTLSCQDSPYNVPGCTDKAEKICPKSDERKGDDYFVMSPDILSTWYITYPVIDKSKHDTVWPYPFPDKKSKFYLKAIVEICMGDWGSESPFSSTNRLVKFDRTDIKKYTELPSLRK